MKLQDRLYYCPVCGAERMINTNHDYETYSGCNVCKNTVMYCSEGDNTFNDGSAVIRFYWFDISKEADRYQYEDLFIRLGHAGYKVFDNYNTFQAFEAQRKHDGETIGLRDIDQFDNQIVSSIGRVFYWFENIWDNKDIKSGYYLEGVKKLVIKLLR